MTIFPTKQLDQRQITALARLWNSEYPEQLCYESIIDFEAYLNGLLQASHYLLMNDGQEIAGWAFKFSRDRQTWFAIILDSSVHHQGFGSTLLNVIKAGENALYGWVVDHQAYRKKNAEVYPSPLRFYLKNGFELVADRRLESAQLSAALVSWRAEKPSAGYKG